MGLSRIQWGWGRRKQQCLGHRRVIRKTPVGTQPALPPQPTTVCTLSPGAVSQYPTLTFPTTPVSPVIMGSSPSPCSFWKISDSPETVGAVGF